MEQVNRATSYLKRELSLSDRDASIVKYGLEVLVTTVSGIAAIIIVGWLVGALNYALIAAFAASLFRVLSGGSHSKSLFNCSLMGAIIFSGIGLITKYWGTDVSDLSMWFLSGITFLFALGAVWRYAPADTPSKPITKPQQIRKLRTYSFGYIVIWAALDFLALGQYLIIAKPVLLAVSLAIVWQSFSITPAGYRLVDAYDKIMPELKLK